MTKQRSYREVLPVIGALLELALVILAAGYWIFTVLRFLIDQNWQPDSRTVFGLAIAALFLLGCGRSKK